MAYSVPTADFVSSTLNGAIVAGATTATIGTGLNIPATNGLLQIDYDSSLAVGVDNGPETIAYATYNSGTGAITGLTRGVAGTTGVAHDNGAKVSSGYSSAHLEQDAATTWTAYGSTVSYGSADSPTFTATVGEDITTSVYPGVRVKLEQEQALSYYWKFESSAASVGSATMADIGTPTYTAGKFDNALTLNGSNQALRITDAAAFHLGASGAAFTIGAWINPTNATNTNSIFSSYSKNTNTAGVTFRTVASTGEISISFANNTAVTTQTILNGVGSVCDGSWHYVVATFKDNYAQLYVDGILNASGYAVTPVFAVTTYTNIGAICETSTTPAASTWFNGKIDDLFIINGYALDEKTIKAKYDAAEEQGTANIDITKYFLCTASSYSAPNTTITMYGGTDYALADATISNVYYSPQKAPYGFPLSPEKWTFIYQSKATGSSAVSTNTWYNLGSFGATIPLGYWNLGFGAHVMGDNSGSNSCGLRATLSKSATSETNPELTASTDAPYNTRGAGWLTIYKNVTLPVKTAMYLNAMATFSSGTETLYVRGDYAPVTIKATSTLL